MSDGPILVECECMTDTAADYDLYRAGRIYTIDMVWAKKRGIWKYFQPVREVSIREAQERIHDEILPERERAMAAQEAAEPEPAPKRRSRSSSST